MNWKGQLVISLQFEREFFKSGVFHGKYIIENKDGEKQFNLNQNLTGLSSVTIMIFHIIINHKTTFYFTCSLLYKLL